MINSTQASFLLPSHVSPALMPKKKKEGSRGGGDVPPPGDEGEDEPSSSSLEGQLTDAIDLLTEKRGSTRESGLRVLIRTMSAGFLRTYLESRRETLASNVVSLIRRGGSQEAGLAARAFSLLMVTLGPSAEDLFMEALPVLTALGRTGIALRLLLLPAQCLEALAMGCFVAGQHDSLTVECMDVCHSQLSAKASGVKVAGLRGWGLLATTLPASQIVPSVLRREAPKLQHLLGSEDIHVRTAAGENVGLLYEMAWQLRQKADEEGSSGVVSMGELTFGNLDAALDALSTDSRKSRSKKDRYQQHFVFRDVLRTVNEGSSPTEKVKIKGRTLVFEGWHQLIQLNALREVLTEGLHIHFMQNDLVRDVFGFEGGGETAETKLNAREKRLVMSAASKDATQQRSREKSRKRDQRMGTWEEEEEGL